MDRAPELVGSEQIPVMPEPAFGLWSQEVHNLDRAVDTLAAVLRELGENAFDRNDKKGRQITAQYEAWAQHVLYAAPPPGMSSAFASVNGRRDWAGLQAFVGEQRRCEYEYVTHTLSGIRAVIPQALAGLRAIVAGAENADRQIQAQMETLEKAVLEGSVEVFRQEAFSVVASVGQIIATRQQADARQIAALQAQLHDLNLQLKQAHAESSLDTLTQLDNRKAFAAHLEETLALRDGFQISACLLLIDADRFKSINDAYGHAVGDIVLKTLADCLIRTFVSHEDCVARYGGEEFAVILREATLPEARRLAERLLEMVRATQVDAGEQTVSFTVSVGIAALQPEEYGVDWLKRADDALYRAKQTGRNRVVVA